MISVCIYFIWKGVSHYDIHDVKKSISELYVSIDG